MRKYAVLITSLFLLLLATGLYAESNDQPKWNATLFGSYFKAGGSAFGIGGAVSCRFTPRLDIEGEVYTIFLDHIYYGLSEGLICNFDTEHNKTVPYVLVGISQLTDEEVLIFNVMFGGGIKSDLTKSLKMKFDLRLHLCGDGIWWKFSTGLMWSFE